MPAKRQTLLFTLLLAPLGTVIDSTADGFEHQEIQPPNIVIVFADDLGYGDLGCYGNDTIRTPHLDRLAAEGTRFTDFYVAQPVCSASRAALLTGCYPNRLGIHGALGPGARHGLNPEETTLAEICKSQGYATGVFGKWHLGHRPAFLPPQQGFDEFLGIPYSNDMWPWHPDYAKFPEGTAARKRGYPDLPLFENDAIADAAITSDDQKQFTKRFTERAVDFIERHHEEPFFLYVPHPMPHVPLFTSPDFDGVSPGGAYGDVIEEIDWSVGQITAALQRHDLTDNTIVIFISDNGPWLSYGNHAGTTGPLREGKGTTFEGGVRVPCIMRWPNRIPAGADCSVPLMTIDLLPTLAGLIGADLPERPIDGRDASRVILGEPDATTPHDAYFFYYHNNHFEAMRSGKWKLHFPHGFRSMEGRTVGADGTPGPYDHSRTTGLELYDLESDIGETTNVADQNPEVMARLLALAEANRRDLGDRLTEIEPTGHRDPGRVPGPIETPEGEAAAAPPNIVFIFADDHAYQAVGAYGSVINTTPNIDRLAVEGMLFRNCFVTNSICGPSRAVVQTGKYSHLNGFLQNGNRFDGSQQTVPKLLQAAGYQTAVIGKWHLGSDPTGFDEWNILIGQGPYYNPPMIANGTRIEHEGYTTDIITELALDWLRRKRDQSKPFMLMFQHKAPHRNWQPSPRHLNMYDDVEIPEPDTLFDDFATRTYAAHNTDMSIEKTLTDFDLKFDPPRNLTPKQLATWNAAYEPKNAAFREANLSGRELVRWKYQRYLKDYLRCVAALDDNIGRVLDYLDASGLAENTIVIYSSDQGFYLGEHGWFDKRWMYEQSLRMPLIVRWPGKVAPGTESDLIVSNLDFGETMLDAADVDIPDDMQGLSLAPILRGDEDLEWRESFYYHYYEFPGTHEVRRHYGVRDARYKLIYFYNLDQWEFYDLEVDPDELNNVHGDDKYADDIARLTEELARLREKYAVPNDTRAVEQ